MHPTSETTNKPAGRYGILVGSLLFFCPPIGLALLAIKNPWTKKAANTAAVISTAWLTAIVVGLFHLPSPPPVDASVELTEFRSFVDRAIDIRNSIDALQGRIEDAHRSGTPIASEEFHRQSLAIRKQTDTIRSQFHDRFGTEIGEYRTRAKGRNDQLFFQASEAVNRLQSIWLEWHTATLRGGGRSNINMHDNVFWEAVNNARSSLSEHVSPPAVRAGRPD